MSATNSTVLVLTEARASRRPNRWGKALRTARHQPLGVLGLAIVTALVLTAFLARFIAPFDPTSIENRSLQSPSSKHLFGTDDKGRDVFSRVVYGSQVSLKIGLIATFIGSLGGAFIGIVSGYFRGAVDMLLQRMMEALQAFPFIILALIMIAIFGTSIVKLMIVVGIAIIPGIGRILRSAVLGEGAKLYVEAARSTGATAPRIMFFHILPNVAPYLIIVATSLLGSAILIEAGLSFLGFGTPPPTPSWGGDLSGNAQRFFVHAPWMAIFPGIALSLVVLGFNLLGDSLRDLLDPRQRSR